MTTSHPVMESFYQNQLLPHFFGGFGRHIYKSQSDVRHDYDEMIVHQHNVMATLEHRLDHSDFLQGSILTAADILLFFHCALRFRYGDDLEDFPNMKKWYGMVSEVDAVNKNWPKGWNRTNKMSAGRQSESHVSESHEKPTVASFDTPLIQSVKLLLDMKEKRMSALDTAAQIDKVIRLLSDSDQVNKVNVDGLITNMEVEHTKVQPPEGEEGGGGGSSLLAGSPAGRGTRTTLLFLKNHQSRHRRMSVSTGATKSPSHGSNRFSFHGGPGFDLSLAGVGEDWDFDVNVIESDPLQTVVGIITNKFLLPAPKETIMSLMEKIEGKYPKHSYHNAYHAADVTHSTWVLLRTLQKSNPAALKPANMFIGLLGAAIHDVGHRGVSNLHLVHSRDDLAITYNDIHVQENFHVAEAFRTMREPDCDVFGNASDEKYDDYRKLLVEMVLATDLSEHFDRVSALKNKKVLHKQLPPETILISALMCADLGHGGRVWAQHESWSTLITKEFYLQGDLEKSLGLPVAAVCNRDELPRDYYNSQIGFLRFMVKPLMGAMDHVLEKETLAKIKKNVDDNIDKWHEMEVAEKEKE
ncbi:hypothetical protein TeGR_g4783, partial [Tetraparma gracilis]